MKSNGHVLAEVVEFFSGKSVDLKDVLGCIAHFIVLTISNRAYYRRASQKSSHQARECPKRCTNLYKDIRRAQI